MTIRQHSFYLEDEDWVALRHYCLDHGMSVSAFVAQAARDAVGGATKEVHFTLEAKAVAPATSSTSALYTGTGAPAVVPINPVRAVPKPTAKKVRARS